MKQPAQRHTTSANPQIIVSYFELTLFTSNCFARKVVSVRADCDERTFSNLFFIKQLCCWTLRLPLSFKKALKQKSKQMNYLWREHYFSLSFFPFGRCFVFWSWTDNELVARINTHAWSRSPIVRYLFREGREISFYDSSPFHFPFIRQNETNKN